MAAYSVVFAFLFWLEILRMKLINIILTAISTGSHTGRIANRQRLFDIVFILQTFIAEKRVFLVPHPLHHDHTCRFSAHAASIEDPLVSAKQTNCAALFWALIICHKGDLQFRRTSEIIIVMNRCANQEITYCGTFRKIGTKSAPPSPNFV